jgi:hydrogenase small subunit
MDVGLSRREFLGAGTTATVLGFSLFERPAQAAQEKKPAAKPPAKKAARKKVAEVPVIWMATGSCSGCSVSLLNAASPTIQEVLLEEVLPGKHVSLEFHATVMAAAGDLAMDYMDRVAEKHKGGYVLVVEGATAAGADGLFCSVGERGEQPRTGYQLVRDLGKNSLAVLAVGACASFGGIPAAEPNPTECLSVLELFKRENISKPVVNIPGCPPHPDWIVGTIATILLGGLEALKLDEHNRPAPFFSILIHDNCPYRGHFDRGDFAERYGEHGCLLKLGCKGPITHADCPIRKFNNGVNWCIEAGHPCIGCCHPDYPFEQSMFHVIQPTDLTPPSLYPPAEKRPPAAPVSTANAAIVGGVIGAVATGAVVAAAKLAKGHSRGAGAESENKE